jgi:prevent-host-death family protein
MVAAFRLFEERTMTKKTRVRASSVTSTEAQNSLGEILGRVSRGERVFVTRYGRREAVLISAEEYAELVGEERVDLEKLERAFEERLLRMQSVEHAAATDALFDLSEDELGEAAAQAVSNRTAARES